MKNDTTFDELPENVKNAIKAFWSYPTGPFECPTGIDPEIWKQYTYGCDEAGTPVDNQ